ncbi:Frizzled-5 [Holothuria leucospilota]|uniref:Frizzled-5 n=1 Tax=Holothuria leucospilota TaxID=206669 RepID=A0A9Q0YDU1_HOLLE|nr:Frizzled-5 [Holothuria leucospilota]
MEVNSKQHLSTFFSSRIESLLIFVIFMWTLPGTLALRGARTCEPITIPMCRDIGYNLTYMPNSFNHDSQEEAGLEVHQFWPLVEIHCSPDLKFFLCSMYTPICVENYNKPLPPCRSVCERAKAGCAPLMRQYGFAWPDRMPCEDLPVYGEDPNNLCMDSNTSESGTAKPTLPPLPSKEPAETTPETCPCSCRAPFLPVPETHNYYNRVVTGTVKHCAIPCYSAYNSVDERSFATFWIALWSIFCFVSTLMTVLTFLIDTERFKYPERPIIFLSGCYLLVSSGFIISLLGGHASVACEGEFVRYESAGPALCTTVFLLIYFFGMASSLWWVILAFTWFLAAGLKWGSEAIASYSQYFHFAAWLVPSIQSILVLAMSSVDGDPVSGICYVGNQNLTNLRAFVLAPLFCYLILGCSFLLLGFVSLFRIRNVIKQGGRKTDKLEKLMIRIGVFSVLYTVPATIVVGCYFYEQQTRDAWQKSHTCGCDGEKTIAKPDYSVYMLKYFMCLVVGITSGVWIWTGKTLDTWRCFFDKLLGRARNRTGKTIQHKAVPLAHV